MIIEAHGASTSCPCWGVKVDQLVRTRSHHISGTIYTSNTASVHLHICDRVVSRSRRKIYMEGWAITIWIFS